MARTTEMRDVWEKMPARAVNAETTGCSAYPLRDEDDGDDDLDDDNDGDDDYCY